MGMVVAALLLTLLFTTATASPSKEHFQSLSASKTDKSRTAVLGDSVEDTVTVTVHFQQAVNTISSHFVGITIDAWHAQVNWNNFSFSSQKVQNLARAYAPTFFRMGGTSADNITYDFTGPGSLEYQRRGGLGAVMTTEPWETLNRFVKDVGWGFIMDLNALKRNADGSWNPDNARELLHFSAAKNYSIAGFELGNEYDLYQRNFHLSVSPQQLATDVCSLQQVLAEFPAYCSSFIIGPEVAGLQQHFFQGHVEDLQ